MNIFQQYGKRITPLGTGLLLLACLSVSMTATGGSSHTVNSGSSITAAELTANGYAIPDDLRKCDSTQSGTKCHTELANYAWRLFIGSMQRTAATLTNGAGRGVGTSTSNFIDTGMSSTFSNPLVFESFYHRTEAFPYFTASAPTSPLGMPPAYYPYYKDGTGAQQLLQTNGMSYVNLDETNQIGQNMIYYRQSTDPDFPVLFMAKVNGTEAGYARQWNQQNAPTANANNTVPCPNTTPTAPIPCAKQSLLFPNNVLEVKTAWRRLSGIPTADQSKYHQASAIYYEGEEGTTPTIKSEAFALIGIHIIQKTKNYPTFIFSTFEHVDAVTRNGSNYITDPATQLLYNNLTYDVGSTNPHTASSNGAYYMNEPNLSPKNNQLRQFALPNSGAVSDTAYTVVEQPTTITSQVNDVNNQVYALINSTCSSTTNCNNNIWANYRLKGVQGHPSSQEGTFDYYLANIVVESTRPGIQLFRGGVIGPNPTPTAADPNQITFQNLRLKGNISLNVTSGGVVPTASYVMGGCQGCHGGAQQAGQDFSFLASSLQGIGKMLDSVAPATMDAAAAKAHNQRTAADNGL